MPDRAEKPELTIALTRLRAQNDGAEMRLTVVLEACGQAETRELTISTAQYAELQPRKGSLTQEQYEELEKASRHCLAVKCGQNILGFAPNTQRQLAGKIMRRGYTREEAAEAAEYLRERGMIDEKKQLRQETEKCLRKLWGARRIKEYLYTRGFGEESIAETDGIFAGVDFAGNCVELIRKHFGAPPEDEKEKQKMIASLSRYGYSLGEIKEAIKNSRR